MPEEIRNKLGIEPGSHVKIEEARDRIIIHRPVNHLVKVYIEPTNMCNLQCSTCMRNVWEEPGGKMEIETYYRILRGIEKVEPRPTLFFGGIGEPLFHPEIVEMTRGAKELGASVELITNGTMLVEDMTLQLVEAGLDMLWVSIDGATPESYADIRLGNELPDIRKNLKSLRLIKFDKRLKKPEVGISVVVMKRNIAELPEIIKMGYQFGAKKFSISNVLPYTSEYKDEILYPKSMYDSFSEWIGVQLPRFDVNEDTIDVLGKLMRGYYGTQISGLKLLWPVDNCPFITRGSVSIRWDGKVSPCLPLLHTHESYLDDRARVNHSHSVGSILDNDLLEIWESPEYVETRQKLQEFDFSPCTMCNSCELADSNEEDCFGNILPTCGGCLWAQGFINCP
ncbi:MAG: radical SAM protein [Spirochaetota bacterium]|nr:MAG: radical SAM protein [Spirochaetota bacterium]